MKHPRDLLHNSKLKAMALLLAVLSWGIVKQITNNEKVITNVPLVITQPEGWAVRDQDVTTVNLTFRGTREALLLLDERTVQVVADLRDEDFEPVRVLTLTPRMVTNPESNVRVTEIEPRQISLRFGKEGSKDLPVLVMQSGQPPEGMTIESIQLEPSVVSLYGEEELLETVSSLQTSSLNLSDRIRSFEQRLDLKPPSEDWVGRVSPARVLAKVTISGVTEEKRIENIPLLLIQAANQPTVALKVTPEKVDVFVEASPQLLEDLTPSDIKAFVAVQGPPGEPRQVRALTPPGVDVLGIRPETVTLTPLPPPAPAPASRPVETPDAPVEESP